MWKANTAREPIITEITQELAQQNKDMISQIKKFCHVSKQEWRLGKQREKNKSLDQA